MGIAKPNNALKNRITVPEFFENNHKIKTDVSFLYLHLTRHKVNILSFNDGKNIKRIPSNKIELNQRWEEVVT